MPDLEDKIVEWRRRMAAGGIDSPAVLDELESHLRDDIGRQAQSGMDLGRAFEAAVQRIGQGDLLKAEFAKIDGWKGIVSGKVIGIAVGSFTVMFSLWAASWLLTVHELILQERMLGLVAVVLTVFSVASWRFSYKYLPIIRSRRIRTAAEVICGFAGVAWLLIFGNLLSNVIVPNLLHGGDFVRGNVTLGLRDAIPGEFAPVFMIGISILWAMTLTAILGAIAYGLEEAARRSNQRVSN